ncbi:MAG: holo-ACP synthase [Deltaproteobacteria bacterium]|nr:holo-ACP synthase [Deltaproteobacteria bacterium]
MTEGTMIRSIGIDVTRVERFKESAADEVFLDRLLTDVERRCVLAAPEPQRQRRCAEVFAAKEAVMKALGTGWNHGVGWKDIEIARAGSGFDVKLNDAALAFTKGARLHLSLSSTKDVAAALAIAEKTDELPDNNPSL